MEVTDNTGCIGCFNKDNLCNLLAPIKDNETFSDIFERCSKIKIKTNAKYICTPCVKILIDFDIFADRVKRNSVDVTNKNDQFFSDVEYLDESIFDGHLITESHADDAGLIEVLPSKSNDEEVSKSKEEIKSKRNTDKIVENKENNTNCSIKSIDSDIKETTSIMEKPEQCIDAKVVIGTHSLNDETQHKFEYGEPDGSIFGCTLSEVDYDDYENVLKVIEDGDFDGHESDIDEEYTVQTLDDTTCVYCGVSLGTASLVEAHVTSVHALDPRTGEPLRECPLCGITITHSYHDHYNRCHNNKNHLESKKYQCLFCDNVYTHMKGYFTHIRMKHGVKLTNDKTPKYLPRNRHKCHICQRDFSQKQILNRHLLKVHGYEVEKRKAYVCPICSERVSYGLHFSEHLLHQHNITEEVEQLEFITMEDFLLFKAATQEDTKVRFRKTTASKSTIEGVRSHYMCSQSGVYVNQGKGKRPAPQRQIYKTGKACPAHMVVTQTLGKVLVVFHKTHIGHGVCPYYEPRQTSSAKKKRLMNSSTITETCDSVEMTMSVCESCGMMYARNEFYLHSLSHSVYHQCCGETFPDVKSWEVHLRMVHGTQDWY